MPRQTADVWIRGFLLATAVTACSSVATPAAPVVETTTTPPPSAAAPVTTVATTTIPAPEPLRFEAQRIEPDSPAAATWTEDCPIALEALSVVTVPYLDFGGELQYGDIVVHALTAEAVGEVFLELVEEDFRIERISLIGTFAGDDNESMAANNTSGFNCRFVDGTTTWSNHAQGLAIDINPLRNPWVTSRGVFPPEGEQYSTRPLRDIGVINPGDPIIDLFAEIGWTWGGDWNQPDYQHFEFEL